MPRKNRHFLAQITVWLLVSWMVCLSFGQVWFAAESDLHLPPPDRAAWQLEQHSQAEHGVCSVFHNYLHCVSMTNGWLPFLLISRKSRPMMSHFMAYLARGWFLAQFRPPIFNI